MAILRTKYKRYNFSCGKYAYESQELPLNMCKCFIKIMVNKKNEFHRTYPSNAYGGRVSPSVNILGLTHVY